MEKRFFQVFTLIIAVTFFLNFNYVNKTVVGKPQFISNHPNGEYSVKSYLTFLNKYFISFQHQLAMVLDIKMV